MQVWFWPECRKFCCWLVIDSDNDIRFLKALSEQCQAIARFPWGMVGNGDYRNRVQMMHRLLRGFIKLSRCISAWAHRSSTRRSCCQSGEQGYLVSVASCNFACDLLLIFVKSSIQRTQMSFLGITKGEAFEDLVKLLLGPNVVDISANERLVAIRNEFLRHGNSWSSAKERLSTWTTLLQEWHAASWASSCCLLDKCFEQMSLLLNMLRVNSLTWKCKILLDMEYCWIWILLLWLPLHR